MPAYLPISSFLPSSTWLPLLNLATFATFLAPGSLAPYLPTYRPTLPCFLYLRSYTYLPTYQILPSLYGVPFLANALQHDAARSTHGAGSEFRRTA